jgi:outer membrane protein OmpA-like peptidoglycan-associated protein
MASRFRGRVPRGSSGNAASTGDEGLGQWWAAIAVLAIAAVAIVSLTSSAERTIPLTIDRAPELLASLSAAARSIDAVESAFESLCQEPVLVALELEPDCETGVMVLSNELFEGYGSAQLGPDAQEDVAAAMTTYLSSLRRLPALWESLAAIEISGHSDPRAVRNPYTTNMVGSQQRALGVLLFLVGPNGLSEADANELQRLAMVSGASFSRPPASCPDRTRECYPAWRRVEIRPVLSESRRRDDWSRTVAAVRTAARRAQQEAQTQKR